MRFAHPPSPACPGPSGWHIPSLQRVTAPHSSVSRLSSLGVRSIPVPVPVPELCSGVPADPFAGAAGPGPGGDASLYILLIMIFYGCLAGGLILAYTRSRKLESKHDPYHLYIERDWGRGGGGPGRAGEEGGGPAEGQRLTVLVPPLGRGSARSEGWP
uniref:Potassium voltage-gated channel subfamily E regulatory subunit 5 n=1 Tax=Strix occidentalis caurina TaxID=311401 RepID=A0A8D0EEL2_STROC